ncbi:helix-turn-helix domain-containing protein [Phosphitispora fastidiosa]|uniref:helix-turn-helix domain-containing protein n=1 Tax=Phosphitispora fastidiosa TaxID=2837202 RepID=UPI001E51F6F3|nr:helix-turn-helix transcriptional regulator [Phosphitispora fastidiosa]MBU7007280.1 transcriptional regulator with XRE-family HTH domain [Phosphitispora fastidiosa]
MSIGKKIKHLLSLREMSQADLVRQTAISKATISDLINDKQKNTSLELVKRISKALRVSPLYFLDENAVTPFEAIPNLPQEIRQFILNEENMDYLVLAHKIKVLDLPAEAVEKIIESYVYLVKKSSMK